ncbi:MAG: aminotransferase class III-fold pyridoxal phosphate-dependent enzyme [Abitibacteriaceae bacterium]|nr:aminotransferase class III-fold pyridoxal phosphate-dependent enzyme [Abditibacteriaceae bacterium]MBV9864963.1 aminotransferase class III-fold pyridoxal phosphate-dependent enzyme [Abditibacteriaceae bacterium]
MNEHEQLHSRGPNGADQRRTDDAAVIADYENYVNPSYAALVKFGGFDSVEVSARGCLVTDSQGRELLDCAGGLGALSVGYSHPRVVAAVKDQLDKMAFSTRLLFNAPQARLGKKLAEITPGDLQYCFFCNSGTEAVEGAIKIARMSTGRSGLVSATGAFHGKSMGALSVSGRDLYKKPFQPLLPDCVNVPFNDIPALEQTVNQDTAAVLLEPIQGEAGVIVPDDGYLRAAREICDRHGALLICDEVQTGLGRTGKMWGCDWDGVAPDIMTLAKALSGSCVPIGAFIGTPRTWEVFKENPLIHSSTFGGNPLACTAALAAIEVIETEGLVEQAATQGEKLITALRETQAKYPQCVKEVRGRGLIIGVEFAHEDIGALVIVGLLQRNVIAAYTINNATTIRFEPPLVITDEQVAWAVRAFDEAVAQTVELIANIEMDEEDIEGTTNEH